MTIRTEEIAKFRTHLLSLCQQTEGWMSTRYFVLMTGKQTGRVSDALENLVELGVLEKRRAMCLTDGKIRRMNCYKYRHG
jgi:hypothetical protein